MPLLPVHVTFFLAQAFAKLREEAQEGEEKAQTLMLSSADIKTCFLELV